ncbi:MAG TPA: hypothetical protein VJ836_00100 [Candidatus Saccharimonadales bacterium]|nr:hypothetical protein [Candidatus Saccharimonadales bacterium]
MSSPLLELAIIPTAAGTYSDTLFGSVPHGNVYSFNLLNEEPIRTSAHKGDIVTVKLALGEEHTLAMQEYWQRYGNKKIYRNCHSFAHIGALLVPATTLSHNLLDVCRLPLDARDTEAKPTPPDNLEPGAAYAVIDHYPGSEHTMLALDSQGLILDINGSGGGLRTGTAAQRIKGYNGTGIQRLSHPTPALGTNYWMTGDLTPTGDDRHVDILIAEDRARRQR